MLNGILDFSAWQLVLVTLALTHVTIATVTIFLHRAQAHRAVELHPAVSHFFRFWSWLTTGMVTSEWVAVHRKHHAKCETPEDPHSPKQTSLATVVFKGVLLYAREAENPETMARYAQGTPDDWLERNLYRRYRNRGIVLMLLIDLVLFGAWGLLVWGVQMLWIPFWAAGVINGVGHYWGYRNWRTPDASTNIVPWGILIGGEELHNNHHAFASSARLSARWWEFDIGWAYIRLLAWLRLAKVRKLAPRLQMDRSKTVVDMDTVRAVLGNRMQILSQYARKVVKPVTKAELCQSAESCRRKYRTIRRMLMQDTASLDEPARKRLVNLLQESQKLITVHQFQEQLQQLWERTAASQEARLQGLQDWIRQAEASGVDALQKFAHGLRGYKLKPSL
ncbi:MAG: fatty acid desaturase [Pseudomonadota bacterium]